MFFWPRVAIRYDLDWVMLYNLRKWQGAGMTTAEGGSHQHATLAGVRQVRAMRLLDEEYT